MKLFNAITKLSKEAALIGSIGHLLSWDRETYMPEKGGTMRSLQCEYMASFKHKKLVSTSFQKALAKLIDIETGTISARDLSPIQIACLKQWRRDFLLAKKLPDAFVRKWAKTTSDAVLVWSKAKQTNDFPLFAPYLDKMISLAQKRADLLGYTDHPYDALLDEYEPEMSLKMLDPLFANLKPFLIDLSRKAFQKKYDLPLLKKKFPEEKQRSFYKEVLEKMGIDFSRGRVDVTEHPFCNSIHPDDLRMTIHKDPSDFFGNLSALLHEGGHGLYEQGLLPEYFGTPICDAVSLGIHESQSRMYETRVGLAQPFLTYLAKRLNELFPDIAGRVTGEELYRGLNVVEPSFIRIHADEVTYPLHVMLRKEIEVLFLEQKITAKDIPDLWNSKMQEYIGITPQTHAQGCLQDVHWSYGLIGYFPTYALGNIYAAQLFSTFQKGHPNWEKEAASGNFSSLITWLNEKIHRHGRRYAPQELVEHATGKRLDATDYKKYLQEKYGR